MTISSFPHWKNSIATDEVIDKEGWLHTGDLGMFDQDGFLVITDRKKHLFVSSGGKNIAPQPIESLFKQSPIIDQFVLIGDKRMFCSALIYPDMENLRAYAIQNSIYFQSDDDLFSNKAVYEIFEKEIDRIQKGLAPFERVRRFCFLKKPLSIDEGELTPTLKVRRKVVEEQYADLIESMYADVT